MSRTIAPKDLEWWRSKIIRGAQNHRTGGLRGFGPVGARHTVHLLDQLVNAKPSYRVSAPTLPEFATRVGLRSKFIPRAVAVAMLARSGLVRAELVPSPSIVLLPDRFARRKNTAQSTPRRRLSQAEREDVFHRDRFKCGHCRRALPPRRLEVGHIVPISLLGADRPANWITLCREHNRAAWDAFDPTFLCLYRGRRVLRPTGVRFRGGFFWPVVLLQHMQTVTFFAGQAAGADIADLDGLRLGLQGELLHAGLGLLVLLTIEVLNVYKPVGMTAYGRRKAWQLGLRSGPIDDAGHEPSWGSTTTRTPRWVRVVAIHAIGVALLFVVMHLAAGGLGRH